MKKLFLFAALVPALFCACQKDEQPVHPTQTITEAYLRIADVAALGMETRAGGYAEDIQINVSAVEGYTEATQTLKSAESWAIATPIPLGATERTLSAFGPAALTPGTLTAGVYNAAKDLVFTNNVKVSATAAAANLTMDHAYAQVTLKFKAENLGSGVTPAITALALNGAPASATFDFKTGVVSAPAAAQPITFTAGAFSDGYVAMVVPQAADAALKVSCSITIDGASKNYSLDLTSKIPAVEKGKNYEVTMTLKGVVLGIGSVDVKPYETSPVTGDLVED